MEEDGVEDSWRLGRRISYDLKVVDVAGVPLMMSLTQVGSANTSRMYSGGLRCSMMRVVYVSSIRLGG